MVIYSEFSINSMVDLSIVFCMFTRPGISLGFHDHVIPVPNKSWRTPPAEFRSAGKGGKPVAVVAENKVSRKSPVSPSEKWDRYPLVN